MATVVLEDHYGESDIRLVKVRRTEDRHDFKDLTVGIHFTGDFAASYTSGDNSRILPADTIKNTVYALAKLYPIEQIEEFAQQLIDHFLAGNAQIQSIRVDLQEHFWARVLFGGKAHPWSFTPAGPEVRSTVVTGTRDSMSIEAGIANLQIVKTTGSGFQGYLRDPFTTLQETSDRVLSTAVKAVWQYSDNEIPYGVYWHGVREAIVDAFVEHESRSMQYTLNAIGEAVLERYADIVQIALSLPNQDYRLVDLSVLGLENNNEVFAPSAQPYELVEARVRR